MGTFRSELVDEHVDDADLALLEGVAAAMLSTATPFLITFARRVSGRASVWIHPGRSLTFRYDDAAARDDVDPWHLDLMTACANSNDGVTV